MFSFTEGVALFQHKAGYCDSDVHELAEGDDGTS